MARRLRKNPSPAEVRQRFDELISEYDVAAMDVAEDLAIESNVSLVELSQQTTHAPWVTYDSFAVKNKAWGYFILNHSPNVPMLVGWQLFKILGNKYEAEVLARVSPAYVTQWPDATAENFRHKLTFALYHNTTWKDLDEAKEGAARDAWNVAKRVKQMIMGETPLPWSVLFHEAEGAMLKAPGHERAPSKFSAHYKGPQRDKAGRFAPKKNPPIDDVQKQYADLILRGMARTLWAFAYGAWAQEDINERDPDALDAFPSSTLVSSAFRDETDFGERRRLFAIDLAKRPPNMPVWLEQAPDTPNAARNAAKWLGGLVVQREEVESLVDLFAIAYEIDTGKVFEYVDPTPKPKKRPEIELFLSSNRGTNLPRDFAESIQRSLVTGVDDEMWATLEAGDSAENDWYWDAWNEVEQNAVITDNEGTKWTLATGSDGDLFLIPEGMEWSDAEEWYAWPEEDESDVPLAEEFGRCLAHMTLADGISWFDEHKQRSADGGMEWQPNLPTVKVRYYSADPYDDAQLTWSSPDETEERRGFKVVGPEHVESTMHRVRITFDRVTPGETDEDEPEYETGWEDEAGVLIEEFDDDDEGIAERTAQFLLNRGAWEASSSSYHPGIWYSQADGETDYTTGEQTRLSFHLAGYTPEEEKEVYDAFKRGRR